MVKKRSVSMNGHPVRFVVTRRFGTSAETVTDVFGRVRVFKSEGNARSVMSVMLMCEPGTEIVGLSTEQWEKLQSVQACAEE